ncbi:GNAT family N-acetyltransferase [Patulibacter sp. S7RM1-6]
MARPSVPTVRPLAEGQWDEAQDVIDLAFHRSSRGPRRERSRATLGAAETIVAEADERVVGTTATWRWNVTVPGGELPCAAITTVTVRPTHRRRGILRAMMDRAAADARAHGAPLAALWASEGAIYGRFGFGPATRVRTLRVRTRGGVPLRAPVPEPLDVELVEPEAAAPLVAPIFARARRRRAGVMDRTIDAWWTARILSNAPEEIGSLGPLRVVLAGRDGYALYRVEEGEADTPVSAWTTVRVKELVAATPEAERTLLTYLTRIDLADEVVLPERPVDDPLLHAPVDHRAVRAEETSDALWLRILDVPAAIAGRGWAADAELVVAVEHPEDEHVAGRWALRVGPDGGRAERTDAAPDLVLPARDLASAYLGDVALDALHAAGTVEERTAGAVAALDAALRTDRAPWTVGVF